LSMRRQRRCVGSQTSQNNRQQKYTNLPHTTARATYQFGKQMQCFEVLQDVALLGCNNYHVEIVDGLIQISLLTFLLLVNTQRQSDKRADAKTTQTQTHDTHNTIRKLTTLAVSINVCCESVLSSFGNAESRPSMRTRVNDTNWRDNSATSINVQQF
jgi:hypothetical protein